MYLTILKMISGNILLLFFPTDGLHSALKQAITLINTQNRCCQEDSNDIIYLKCVFKKCNDRIHKCASFKQEIKTRRTATLWEYHSALSGEVGRASGCRFILEIIF